MVIWILTKKGEILNDKFYVFKDVLTMLGVNFNLNCGTFVPKLNSLYKFMIQLSSLLNKRDVTVSHLQELIGKFTWIIRDRKERVCLKPIHKYIGSLVKKFKPKNSAQYKQLSYKTIPWNKRLLIVCFDMLWAIKTAFLNFNMPVEMSDGSVLEIITDSNPVVAGGYMIKNSKSQLFEPLNIRKMETIPIAKPLECYVKTYGLHSIFHSKKAEVFGLLKYLEKHIEYIVQHEQDCMEILVYGDNLGDITLLNTGMSKDVHMHLLIQKIYNLLKRTKEPFSFAWLRRSTPRIELADQLGRVSDFSFSLRILD